jgi:hypothetical protein
MPGLSPRTERALWIVVLLAAASLRFAGIAHHVERGSPDFDEQNNFIRPIERMWREGTLDPTVYQGYAGLFNWIAAVPVLAGSRLDGFAGSYAAGRGVVAVFGLLNVGLVGLLARRFAGPSAGLFAGALLAVSRLDVRAAHHITPDVLVGSAVLGVLLLLDRPLLSRGREAAVGALVGLGAAVKYTGFLGAIPAGVAALLQPGLLPRSVRMGLVATAVFALAAPYAVLELTSRGSKLSGMLHYYGEKAERRKEQRGGSGGFREALGYLEQGAGPVALGLVVAAPFLFVDRRRLAPALATVGAGVAAMAPAAQVFPRHVVPVAVVVAALAGIGFGLVVARGRRGAPALALGLVATSLPFQASDAFRLTAHYLEPSAVQLAAEWLERDPARAGLVLTSLPRLALDPERFEVRRQPKLQLPRTVLEQFDYLVTTGPLEPAALPSFPVLARFPSEDGIGAGLITVLGPPPDARTGLAAIATPAATASAAGETAALAVDGDRATTWRAPASGGALELRFAAPARVVRVEIEIGDDDPWSRRLRLSGQQEDGEWQTLAAEPLRPSTDDRQRAGVPRGQVFVLTNEGSLVALRVDRPDSGAWSVAEIRVLARGASSR